MNITTPIVLSNSKSCDHENQMKFMEQEQEPNTKNHNKPSTIPVNRDKQ